MHRLAVLATSLFALTLLACGGTTTPTTDPDWKSDPAMQAKRKQLVQELGDRGYFQKWERLDNETAAVWVTPAFMALNFDEKQRFASVVFAHYLDGPDAKTNHDKHLEIRSASTNKTLGHFGPAFGGLKFE